MTSRSKLKWEKALAKEQEKGHGTVGGGAR